MKITYQGAKAGHEEDRVAIIEFTNKETTLADRICDFLNKIHPYYRASICDNMMIVSVDDRQDFEEFKGIYKEAKAMFIGCMKYGF